MLRRSLPRLLTVAGASVGIMLVLAACTPGELTPSPEPSVPATASAEPSAEPTPAGPVLVPEGSAADNLPLFAALTQEVWAGEDRASGRAYIDALTAAGFDKTAMQVTEDRSTVGNPAESIQFSVRWGDEECLIGQVGPSTGEPVTAVMPQLADGRCLIGSTRPIDW